MKSLNTLSSGEYSTSCNQKTILLIAIVLLQSGKAESANIIQGSTSELFQNRKERGAELFISRLTFVLGFTFFVLCTFISFM